jgi:outer membrane protein assembly factor BamE (lipoprotein component of BamABCDE complex)
MAENRMNRFLQLSIAVIFLAGCATGLSSLEHASEDYRHNRGYTSLETICNVFYIGMPRSEVERLLGAPDYSPIDGQYYYSSDRSVESQDQGGSVSTGLVVDYRDASGNVTDTLHEFTLGPIGE